MREFKPIISLGNDQYEVTTITDKKGKKIEDTYIVDLRTHYCTCKAWFMNHKKNNVMDCTHLRTVVQMLRDKGHCIQWDNKERAHYDLGLIKREVTFSLLPPPRLS